MKCLLIGLLCAVVTGTVMADNANAVRKRAVGSMLVTGSIEVMPDGHVGHYDLDQLDKLPPPVVQLLGKTIAMWRFEPVLKAGRPVSAIAKMSARVIASPVEHGNYAMTVSGAEFGEQVGGAVSTDTISEAHISKPSYPRYALESRVSGTVYVLMRVDRKGQVENASAQQVNLRQAGNDLEMEQYRHALADAATSALKRSTFHVPTTGGTANDPSWVVRVPVVFHIYGEKTPAYGQWEIYIPGPLESAPWVKTLPTTISNDKLITQNIDATAHGGTVLSSGGLHLINHADGS